MRYGIFGGSFSPPHDGHVALARAFMRELSLDRLYVVPAKSPPHKKLDCGASASDRIDMCRAAFAPLGEKCRISEYEMEDGVSGYTVDTLRHFAGSGEMFMLCGSDMFLTLDTWREPAQIFSLATVVCAARVDDPETDAALARAAEHYRCIYGGESVVMKIPPVEISSTEIRRTLESGGIPRGIPDGVLDIIRDRGLYGYRK